ncbi:transcriptional regulator [Planctomycetota bacterium]|nr:transcriptional regulator [Planctomycetota bacterium]
MTTTKARDKILFLLKTKGPATATALAVKIGVTAMAVRQHLYAMQKESQVEFFDERKKVGRPARNWKLTAESDGQFPDSHGELAVGILDAARKAFGEAGIDKLLEQREAAQFESYSARLQGKGSLLAQVQELANIRELEGYMAECEQREDGEIALIENHCPICAAATSCQKLCEGELGLFSSLMDNAEVERTEHIINGSRRCVYIFKELATVG